MKIKSIVIVILIMLLIAGIKTNSLAANKENTQEILKVYKELIVDENWYKGNYSYFYELRGKEVSYELYFEKYQSKKILGEIGEYYLLIKEKTGIIAKKYPVILISKFDYGITKEHGIWFYRTIDEAQKLDGRKAKIISTGMLKIDNVKPDYGSPSTKEIKAAEHIIKLIKNYHGTYHQRIKSGNYDIYIKRFSNYDSLTTIVLCNEKGKKYFMDVGELKKFEIDELHLELDIEFKVPEYKSEIYNINQIIKFSQHYKFTL